MPARAETGIEQNRNPVQRLITHKSQPFRGAGAQSAGALVFAGNQLESNAPGDYGGDDAAGLMNGPMMGKRSSHSPAKDPSGANIRAEIQQVENT